MLGPNLLTDNATDLPKLVQMLGRIHRLDMCRLDMAQAMLAQPDIGQLAGTTTTAHTAA
ncbi:MAG: hypothetical protein ABJA93_14800 [Sporichthyaceae bacterium]